MGRGNVSNKRRREGGDEEEKETWSRDSDKRGRRKRGREEDMEWKEAMKDRKRATDERISQ